MPKTAKRGYTLNCHPVLYVILQHVWQVNYLSFLFLKLSQIVTRKIPTLCYNVEVPLWVTCKTAKLCLHVKLSQFT